MNVYRKWRVLIIAVSAIAAMLAYCISSMVESRLARWRVEALMGPAINDMREEMLAGLDPVLYYLSSCVTNELPTVASAVARPDRVKSLAHTLALDEINFIDTNGVIRATTHPSQQDYWMGTDPDPEKAAGFLCLLTNHLWYTQPPRTTVQADGVYRKFAGIRLPDGALQLGFDFSRLSQDLKTRFADTAVDWHVGESGYYVIADCQADEVISDGNPDSDFIPGLERTPVTLRDLGFEPEMLEKGEDESFVARIAGVEAICRVAHMPQSGHVFCVVVPIREIARARNISVYTTMFILLVLIASVALAAFRIVRLRERADQESRAEEARRQKELMLATAIQSSALPSAFPPFPSIADCVDIFASMRAAKEVGGDFYDFYFVDEHSVAFVVADVSGKGVPGAMFMMRAKATFNDLLSRGGDLGAVVSAVNAHLADGNDTNMFVTAWIGVLDLRTGTVEYVNCGHNPPLVRRVDGTLEWVRSVSGIVLAAFDGVPYESHKLTLRPGDRLFLYTDGVVEAKSRNELFGEERLASAVAQDVADAKGVCTMVEKAVDAFVAGEPQADDITMLALGFNGVHHTFVASTDGLAAATSFVKGFCDDHRAAIVIDEIASNIVRCSGASTFELTFRRAASGYTLVFSDAGKPFNPLAHPDPDVTASAEDRTIGGLGIFMVKQMADSVNYEWRGDRNVLTVNMKNA